MFVKTWYYIVVQIFTTISQVFAPYCYSLAGLLELKENEKYFKIALSRGEGENFWKLCVYSKIDVRKCESELYAAQWLVRVVISPITAFYGIFIYFGSVILNWNDILDIVHIRFEIRKPNEPSAGKHK